MDTMNLSMGITREEVEKIGKEIKLTREEVEEIRKTPLFLSRFNRMMSFHGQHINALSASDAELVKMYCLDENELGRTCFVHYTASVDSSGIVCINLKDLSEYPE